MKTARRLRLLDSGHGPKKKRTRSMVERFRIIEGSSASIGKRSRSETAGRNTTTAQSGHRPMEAGVVIAEAPTATIIYQSLISAANFAREGYVRQSELQGTKKHLQKKSPAP